jgi:hypothetical protein
MSLGLPAIPATGVAEVAGLVIPCTAKVDESIRGPEVRLDWLGFAKSLDVDTHGFLLRHLDSNPWNAFVKR